MSLILVPIGIIIFLRLNKSYQFLVLSLAALLPFSFGNFSSVPNLLLIEWLPLVVFISMINELVPVHSIEKKIRKIKFKGLEIFIFAIIILIIWTIISIINNEILKPAFLSGETGTKRLYFNIFNNILLFFTTIIFVVTYYEKIEFNSYFKIILYTSLVVGGLRMITYIINYPMPLLAGGFNYGGAQNKAGETVLRFGGMTDVVVVGIPALFSLYVVNGKLNKFGLLLLLIYLFLSGGRTVMLGTIFSVVVFSFLFLPKNFIYLILAGAFLFLIVIVFAPQSLFEGQVNRLSTLDSGNFMGQDAWRGMAWLLYFKTFAEYPIWGKGISEYQGFIYSTFSGTEEFARAQLFSGGHGSYFSLLSTFGLGGIVYFIIMVAGGIILSYRKIKEYLEKDLIKTAIGVFCFMLLIIKSVDLITSGNGLDVPILFFMVGLSASLTALKNRENIQ